MGDALSLGQRRAAGILAVLLALAAAGCSDGKSSSEHLALVAAQASACSAKTPSDGALASSSGTYFAPGSPRRRNLREPGMRGIRLTLRGHVYDEECSPVRRALLDFFQADSRGKYDRSEIRLHGHQFTDARGRYLLRTIVPNHYLRRPPHIHVRVQAANGPVLATELFFPATLRAYGLNVGALNRHARGFKRALTVRLGPRRHNAYRASFDFVIAVARFRRSSQAPRDAAARRSTFKRASIGPCLNTMKLPCRR